MTNLPFQRVSVMLFLTSSIALKQVVQDSCRVLALQDVSLLSSSVAKLVKAVQMLPRLERFVNR